MRYTRSKDAARSESPRSQRRPLGRVLPPVREGHCPLRGAPRADASRRRSGRLLGRSLLGPGTRSFRVIRLAGAFDGHTQRSDTTSGDESELGGRISSGAFDRGNRRAPSRVNVRRAAPSHNTRGDSPHPCMHNAHVTTVTWTMSPPKRVGDTLFGLGLGGVHRCHVQGISTLARRVGRLARRTAMLLRTQLGEVWHGGADEH